MFYRHFVFGISCVATEGRRLTGCSISRPAWREAALHPRAVQTKRRCQQTGFIAFASMCQQTRFIASIPCVFVYILRCLCVVIVRCSCVVMFGMLSLGSFSCAFSCSFGRLSFSVRYHFRCVFVVMFRVLSICHLSFVDSLSEVCSCLKFIFEMLPNLNLSVVARFSFLILHVCNFPHVCLFGLEVFSIKR